MTHTHSWAIIGMQYGSEAKGALAGYLATEWKPDTVMANWSPNAGHTYVNGEKLVRRCIPIGTVSENCRTVLLGPGSIIDPVVFQEEFSTLDPRINVIIHPQAALCENRHLNRESAEILGIGSTQKGAGAAAMERMMRNPSMSNTAGTNPEFLAGAMVSLEAYHDFMADATSIQIEGCQGHSLSLYNGFYPYVTSRDTSIHQLKADLAWHNAMEPATYGCIRTYPIRVAGTSGPCYDDQMELSWDDLGVEPEITTVTKKVRRVFTFSEKQIADAFRINRPDDLYLSGCDYIDEDEEIRGMVMDSIYRATDQHPRWMSFGPKHEDMQLVL